MRRISGLTIVFTLTALPSGESAQTQLQMDE
jgi:hypothetical protein